MATKNIRKNNTKVANTPVDMGEGYGLIYRENDYGLFGLEHDGAIIYGCTIRETRDGHLFVSYPSRKGKDGKYYAHARFTEAIPDAVVERIAAVIAY